MEVRKRVWCHWWSGSIVIYDVGVQWHSFIHSYDIWFQNWLCEIMDACKDIRGVPFLIYLISSLYDPDNTPTSFSFFYNFYQIFSSSSTSFPSLNYSTNSILCFFLIFYFLFLLLDSSITIQKQYIYISCTEFITFIGWFL